MVDAVQVELDKNNNMFEEPNNPRVISFKRNPEGNVNAPRQAALNRKVDIVLDRMVTILYNAGTRKVTQVNSAPARHKVFPSGILSPRLEMICQR